MAHHLSCAVDYESDLNKAGGHYTAAFARPKKSSGSNLQWLSCDDAMCSSLKPAVALKKAWENAYVVVYDKVP